MPLSTHFSYQEMINLYSTHWAAVNAEIGGAGLVIMDGVNHVTAFGLIGAFAAKLTELVVLENDEEFAVGSMNLLRPKILERLNEFNLTVRVWWKDTPAVATLPPVPFPTASVDKLLHPLRRALRVWDLVNAGPTPSGVTLPLKLGAAQDFARADLAAIIADLTAFRETQEEAEFNRKIAREQRDAMERRIREILFTYARAVPLRLGPLHPLSDSLPRLTPLPGHTPKPVSLTASWDPEKQAARLQWTPSDDPKLSHYQVRWCHGPTYNKKQERTAIITATQGDHIAWTPTALEAPGATATYKVYVILTTENERASPAISVTRL